MPLELARRSTERACLYSDSACISLHVDRLMKIDKVRSMSATELLKQLADAGAVAPGIIAAESSGAVTPAAPAQPTNRWQRALKPALQKSKSELNTSRKAEADQR